MNHSYFGFKQRPFRTTPDTDSYYPATGHERILARLLEAVHDDEGMMLVTGATGTGKTLLCHRLLETLGDDVVSVFLTNTHCPDRAGLLQAILYDLALPYEGRREQELRLALTDALLKNFAAGKRTVLIIDEAQHLSADLLEELRLLSNLEARQGKAVQVILAAQRGLEKLLESPEMAALAQRLSLRLLLEPLGVHEAADYVMHQLRMAGGKPDQIMSGEAVEVLARGSRGVPRVLNQSARQALHLAQHAGVVQVDAEAALEALALLGLEAEENGGSGAAFPTLVPSQDELGEDEVATPMLSLTSPEEDILVPPELFGSTQRPA